MENKSNLKKKYQLHLLFIIVLLVGIGLGSFFSKTENLPVVKKISSEVSEKRSGLGKFTNPLLECSGVHEEGLDEIGVSKTGLKEIVDSLTNSKKVGSVSVYFRDLNDGPWIGINEDDEFIGASLLKVPVLISYLYKSEKDPSELSKKIKYTKILNSDSQYFESSRQIQFGETYTAEDLLNYMIVYSDNNAMDLLATNLKTQELVGVFDVLSMRDLDVSEPYLVDVKTYASFFRVLFNASYLNREYSEKALEILSRVEFNEGITKQIPKNILVAHKFGIRTDGAINQLHDCGIIYYPNRPYLLCIMSKGGAFPDMADSISKISKFVYDEIDVASKK